MLLALVHLWTTENLAVSSSLPSRRVPTTRPVAPRSLASCSITTCWELHLQQPAMRISGWQTYPQFLSLSAKDQTNRVYRIGKWMLNLTVSCWHDRPPDAILSSPSDSLKPTRDARYCFHLPKLGMISMLVCQREADELGQHQMENCPTSSSTSPRIPEWAPDTAFHFGIRFRKESHKPSMLV